MCAANVPTTVQELVERYDRLILWGIHRTAGVRLTEDEVQDIRQQVYVRIIERDFLGRCRVYYATHEGKFSTSLTTFVRNVTLNIRDAEQRDPLRLAAATRAQREDDDRVQADLDQLAMIDPELRNLETRDFLASIAARLEARPGEPPRVPARVILQLAIEHGLHSQVLAEHTGVHSSTIRHYLQNIRAVAHSLRMESPCTPGNTTRSTPLPRVAKIASQRSSSR